jgi:hypothetical protein
MTLNNLSYINEYILHCISATIIFGWVGHPNFSYADSTEIACQYEAT